MSQAYEQHQQDARDIRARCAVITLSDSRDESRDQSGAAIKQLLMTTGHSVTRYREIPDDPATLASLLSEFLDDPQVDLILTSGGTGISRRDQTIPVIERIIEQPLPGFGELFRALSFEQIGAGAMLSRAVAGVASGK